MKIPTYAADGSPLFPHTRSQIERLERASRAVVERRKGRIVSAFLRHPDGGTPIRKTPSTGQRYSYAQRLKSGRRAWKHCNVLISSKTLSKVLGKPVSQPEADRIVQKIFRAVELSCMGAGLESPSPAKVICIDSGRKKRTAQRRPVEFDSQGRLAA